LCCILLIYLDNCDVVRYLEPAFGGAVFILGPGSSPG